ncbi:hypothetical protein A3K79_03525 [Candidatus Bathyarchaeota archaeon RBG_13_46_16b]|nr:MAG: hypothetical protein A3K79_03525 [Candidatus Bathyarchaeota archaeon RBG_13_46_16b]
MKELELKLISELMKNSRRSDRDLARAIGTSQPTVTRLRTRLEKEGFIKEYTAIPDFSKLGFELMALTFVKYTKPPSEEELIRIRELARELEKKAPPSDMMIMSGMGLDHSRVILSLHENFASFREFSLRESIFDVTSVESFVIGLDDKTHYRPFTLQTLAKYLPHMNAAKR